MNAKSTFNGCRSLLATAAMALVPMVSGAADDIFIRLQQLPAETALPAAAQATGIRSASAQEAPVPQLQGAMGPVRADVPVHGAHDAKADDLERRLGGIGGTDTQ